jgi:endonuclease/exonuclease/phosphatase family metal-dependent hydrolase
MTIVSLNIWGGRAGSEKIFAFFEKYRDTVDIFCLQEVWSDRYDDYEGVLAGGKPLDQSLIMTHALRDIGEKLPHHTAYFHPGFLDNFGLCTFVRNTIPVHESGDTFVHRERGYIPTEDLGHYARNLQYLTLELNEKEVTVMNFHGLWNGKGKTDCEERLIQSDRIIEFIQSLTSPYILCGDFNLLPDTESIQKFEHAGMRNLISEFNITSTRTPLYDKPVGYADYAFVSEGIEVTDFKVLPDEVSDHAPLQLDIA